MRRRIVGTIGAMALLGAVLAASTATAAPPAGLESYAAGSTATALQLRLAGAELAVSRTGASVSSDPQAVADGAAFFVLFGEQAFGFPEDGRSTATDGTDSFDECAFDLDLNEASAGQLSLLDLGAGCLETSASVVDGAPGASSVTGELAIRVTSPAGEALALLLGPLFEGVRTVTDPILDALAPITGPVADLTGIDLSTVINELLDNLEDPEFVLLEILVAPTVSTATADDQDGVAARAGANGITINILPGIAQSLEDAGLDVPAVSSPLATIVLGQATAEVVRDPATGEIVPDASAAQLLDVRVSESLGVVGDILGELGSLLDLAADGNPLSCGDAGNPLADVLCISAGEVRDLGPEELTTLGLDFGEGTVGQQASAATIRLLPIAADFLGSSVLELDVATASAAANAQAALPGQPTTTTTEAAAPAPETPRQLPRTGTDSVPMGLLAGLAGAAAVGFVLVRRSALA